MRGRPPKISSRAVRRSCTHTRQINPVATCAPRVAFARRLVDDSIFRRDVPIFINNYFSYYTSTPHTGMEHGVLYIYIHIVMRVVLLPLWCCFSPDGLVARGTRTNRCRSMTSMRFYWAYYCIVFPHRSPAFLSPRAARFGCVRFQSARPRALSLLIVPYAPRRERIYTHTHVRTHASLRHRRGQSTNHRARGEATFAAS